MPLQPVDIRFTQGVDTKTDPWQIAIGRFLRLVNGVFTKTGLLLKRNGYGQLATPPNSSSIFLTTLNDALTAVSSVIAAYIPGNNQWVSKGTITPLNLSVLSLIKNSVNQTQCDAAVAPNGLVCTVYTQTNAGASTYKYAIADSTTGQNIISPTAIPVASGTVTGSPRVFVVGDLFVIVFTNVITAVSHLQYVSISSYSPSTVTTNADLVSSYISATTLSWDAVVANSALYFAYNTTTGGQQLKIAYLSYQNASTGGAPVTATAFAAEICTIMSLCVDTTVLNQIVYLSYWDSAGSTGKMAAVDLGLVKRMDPTSVITSGTVLAVASAAQSGVCTFYYEVSNNYSYDSGVPSHYVAYRRVTLPATVTTGAVSPAAGSAASGTICLRSVGLASKVFIIDSVQYFLSVYQSPYQSTYFLVNGTSSVAATPVVVAKLAYQNAGGYLTLGLPNALVTDSTVTFPYLIKDFIAAETTVSATPVSGFVAGVYSQTGVNLAAVTFGDNVEAVDLASCLQMTGGFLWGYDGYLPVEHNFFLYPDSVEITTATSGGLLTDQDYFYIACYEWSDNQGNVYRSTPSIAVKQTTAGGNTSANTVNVPYLRLTYKTANPAKIVIYRWSTAQPVYHRITSLTTVQSNVTTSDSLAFVDILADTAIAGNDILYTTGGVVEDTNAPAFDSVFPFDDRLWGIESETNLLWFSKTVVKGAPVEMSDLLTYNAAPSIGAQGPTGPILCGSAMDDKLVLFRRSAMHYINGTGPDNTGANSGYPASPIFITSTVGCSNQKSIIFMPDGLMFEFQSEAGNQIWLLGRGMATAYIGAEVEGLTQEATVLSAVNVPGLNQVRFTLSSGITLMYDYYQKQWGWFQGVAAQSSCIYGGLHTFIDSAGRAFQESPGVYLDGANPVLMGLTTGWVNTAGLQGYQRAIMFYLMGRYYSPHKLNVQVAYDYNSSPLHYKLITPTNYSPAYGGDGSDSANPYGQQGTYGGPDDVEKWRIFFKRQRCIAFQLIIDEVFDASKGVQAGAGLTLSGLNMIVAVKKGFYPASSKQSGGMR